MIKLNKKGMVGGYSSKLLAHSPCSNVITDLWKPQPGQSSLKMYLNGQGSKKISALRKTSEADIE
jgi:hypothetical protein